MVFVQEQKTPPFLNILFSGEDGSNSKIALCVKGISFSNPLMVYRLVEWIELQKLLGVDRIFFHYTNVATEILDMLKYYERKGHIDLKEYVWAGPYSK